MNSHPLIPPENEAALITVDVAGWPSDEDYPVYPEGSRDKQLLRCPEQPQSPLLVPHHRYQFKQSRDVYPEQLWAEVVAYHIGLLTGVQVPPAYAAWNSTTGVCAALIEWFYGYEGRPQEGFHSGGVFMKALIPDYDMRRGKQHNFDDIMKICQALAAQPDESPIALDADWLSEWTKMLTFDALIGNTDRHHENWGFIYRRSPEHIGRNARLAPAFDNGTSLGIERLAAHFQRFQDHNYLERYLAKGRHHLRWKRSDGERVGHCELLLKLVETHAACRDKALSVLAFDPAALEAILMALTALHLPVPLSLERARFMLYLTLARQDRLARALAP